MASERTSFPLGYVVATPGAMAAMMASGQSPGVFLNRHARLEQGDLSDDDHRLNAGAIVDGSRIFSAFATSEGDRLWVITEADRSVTTILLPDEY